MPELLPLATNQQSLKLLADTAAYLLLADNPQTLVQTLVARLAPQLHIDVCFYYLVEEGSPRMRLEFFQGVPPEIAEALGSLEFDHALCQSIVSVGRRLVLEDIVQSAEPEMELVRCLGMTAYACYPLLAYGGLLGMLGFGSRSRPSFDSDELELLQSISFQLAAAMERLRMITILQQRNKALQVEVAERQEAEAAVLTKEKQLKLITNTTPVMLAQCSSDQRFIFVNRAYAERFGLTPDQIIGKSIAEVMGPEVYEKILPYVQAVLQGQSVEFEIALPFARSGERIMHVTYVPELNDRGQVRAWVASIADVTERQQAEEIRNRLGTVVESSDDAIVAKTLDGTVTAWNKGAERIFGYTAEEMIGRPIDTLIPPERRDEETTILGQLRKGERIEHYETIRVCKDGRCLDVSLTVSPIKDSSGKIIGASKIARDITESRRAREAIKSSLAEKEVLLKEVHHRVKNNMQIISSLLSLQSGSIDDPRVADLFEASQNRIRSMALVHERLYGTEDLSRVEMGSYIRSLASDLIKSYGADISINVEADEIVFGLDIAIPCGLMLNELIVNAVKHAFPNGRKGTLRIILSRQEREQYLLTIQDDGVGLPLQSTPATTKSLGLRLVQTLAGQLHGTIQIERKEGTTFAIRFSADREGKE